MSPGHFNASSITHRVSLLFIRLRKITWYGSTPKEDRAGANKRRSRPIQIQAPLGGINTDNMPETSPRNR
ncbi:hypothetical protein EOD41_10280 [Mucilaginibacter limnophilus]|uniref:Uncharacterized protein n=1 Tax=Mucilaginibacter limnophilus TaxID=1932778 RepID=A0A3S2Y127_9SPHI|nr:hypothetical protein EOD41_10280 [Mucilaginibacter limnophilus]